MSFKKLNKTEKIPFPEDMAKFSSGLKQEIRALHAKFRANPNAEIFKLLNERVCTYVLIFNKKRPGELGESTLEDYTNAKSNDIRKEEHVVASFSALEKHIMKRHFVMRIIGKIDFVISLRNYQLAVKGKIAYFCDT